MASGRTPDFGVIIARRQIIGGEASKPPASIHVPFVLVFDRVKIPRCFYRVVYFIPYLRSCLRLVLPTLNSNPEHNGKKL